MELNDLWSYQEKYDDQSRIYKLEFHIPEASTVCTLFEEGTPTEAMAENLAKRFDAFFKNGEFIFMFEPTVDGVDEAIWDYSDRNRSPEILGSWVYSRNDRLCSLAWNTPEWFEDLYDGVYIVDKQGLFEICNDWITNCVIFD